MGSMNENSITILLRSLMDSPYGWGRDQGRIVYHELLKVVDIHPEKTVIGISLRDVERNDISFAAETAVELARRYRGVKGIYLFDLIDADMLENWDAAAARANQPIMVKTKDGIRAIGVHPSQGNIEAFEYILNRASVTASEMANTLNLKIANASTKLKQLYEQGFLLRQQEIAESGGVEYRYFAIQ